MKKLAWPALLLVVSLVPASKALELEPRRFFQFWRVGGNETPRGAFLGTLGPEPLIFKTNADGDSGDGERMRITKEGNIGIGLSEPGQRVHLGDGNLLIEGGDETALMIKRDVTFGGFSGQSVNPIFHLGRITDAGDGDPELRVFYSDDNTEERSVFEFDRKGIVASVKPDVGSHFEGFIGDDPAPLFRLNSFPSMQLEMGAGGSDETDVFVRRETDGDLTLHTASSERLRVAASGQVGIGTASPRSTLQVAEGYLQLPVTTGAAPPDSDCDEDAEAGRMLVRTDGPPDLYICLGATGWVTR